MPNNKITFGLRNVHYSIATQDNNGNWSFDTPVALPGAQEFSSEVVGGSTNVYADDTLYASLVQNAGRTLTLKFTEIPDDFKTAVLGYKRLANGNLVEIANAPVVTFAKAMLKQEESGTTYVVLPQLLKQPNQKRIALKLTQLLLTSQLDQLKLAMI